MSKLDDFGLSDDVKLALDPEGTQKIGLDTGSFPRVQEAAAVPAAGQAAPVRQESAPAAEPEDPRSGRSTMDNAAQQRTAAEAKLQQDDILADYFTPQRQEGIEKVQAQAPAAAQDSAPLASYIAALNEEIANSEDLNAERVTVLAFKMFAEAIQKELDLRDSKRDALLKDAQDMMVDEALLHYKRGIWNTVQQTPAQAPQALPRTEDAAPSAPAPEPEPEPAPAAPPTRRERAKAPSGMPPVDVPVRTEPAKDEEAEEPEEAEEAIERRPTVPVWLFIAIAAVMAAALVLVVVSAMTGLPITALGSLFE